METAEGDCGAGSTHTTLISAPVDITTVDPTNKNITLPSTLSLLTVVLTARIIGMIGDTAAMSASGEVTTQAVAIAQVERWRAWLRGVFLYTRSNGEVWNRTGIETYVRYLIRHGNAPPRLPCPTDQWTL